MNSPISKSLFAIFKISSFCTNDKCFRNKLVNAVMNDGKLHKGARGFQDPSFSVAKFLSSIQKINVLEINSRM